MGEVKRYRAAMCDCGDTRDPEGPVDDGDWVRYTDYVALEQRLSDVTACNEALKGKLETAQQEARDAKAGWDSCIADLRKAAEICRESEAQAKQMYSPGTVVKNRSTPQGQEFWNHVEAVAEQVREQASQAFPIDRTDDWEARQDAKKQSER